MARSTVSRAARFVGGAMLLSALALTSCKTHPPTVAGPKWDVPVGERRVLLTEAGDGEAKRFVVENGFFRAAINPARGGRVESFIYKKTNQELTVPRTETCPGGFLSDQLWEQDYSHSDWNASPYEAVVLAKPPESGKVRIQLSCKGRLWAGVTIQKTITVAPDRSALQVEYEMRCDNTVDKKHRLVLDFWFHNAVRGAGKAFLPSPSGVLVRPLAAEADSWLHEPTRGWNAFITDQGAGVAATMEYRRLRALRSAHTPVNTVEWVWRYVSAVPGMKITSPVQLGLFSGLSQVDGVCDDAVIEMNVEPAPNGVAAHVKVAALVDLDATLSLSIVQLQGPARVQNLSKGSGLDVKLKADSVGSYNILMPVAADGSCVIQGTLLRADKPLLAFEKDLILGQPTGVYSMAPEGPREPEAGRRYYIPFDFNFNKLAYETPHVKWARPYALGRPRVLALVPARAEREAIELAQRFDMDLTCSFMVKGNEVDYALGDGYNTLRKEDLVVHMDKTLERDYDVILLGEDWDLLTAQQQQKVLAKVENGAGLLVTGAAPDGLKDKLPLAPAPAVPLGPWTSTVRLTGAIPFAALPETKVVPCALRTVTGDAARPEALLMAGKAVIAAQVIYGKGRIVQLSTSGPFALRSPLSLETHPFDYWEYQYALLGRLLYRAAAKDSPVDVVSVTYAQADQGILIGLQSQVDGPVKVHVRLRDKFGAVLDERDMNAILKKDQQTAVGFIAPAQTLAGCCLADVIVSDKNGTLAWGAGAFPPGEVKIEKLQTDKVKAAYQPDEKVTLTAKIKGNLPPGAKLRGEIWDGGGRKVAVAEVPAEAETKLALPVDRVLTPIFEARATLFSDSGVMDQAVCEGWVKLPRRRDQFQAYFWGYPGVGSSPAPMVYEYYKLFREIGMNTNWGDKAPEQHAWAFERLGMSFELPTFGMSWGGITKAAAAKDPEKGVPGSIGDPDIDESYRLAGVKYAEWSYRNVFMYGCADENRDPPPDVCFCKLCLAAFRNWLQETQYKTLDDLNKEWKTDFKTWDEVMPMTEAEVKEHGAKTGCYGAWADMRQFNKWSYANHVRAGVQGVLSVDPQALVGDSGTQESFPQGARDYSMLSNSYTAMSAYGGTQTPEQDGANPKLIRYMWTGYGKPNPRDAGQCWMHLGNNNYGFALFVSGTYIDPDWTLPTDGRDLQVAIRQMNRGPGQLLVSAHRTWDPVWVLQSTASLHGACVTGQQTLHAESIKGYMALMSDLGTGYRAMPCTQLAQGHLQQSGARVLVLPHMVALSEAECRNIRIWVEQGGTVIADLMPGLMDEHCRMLPKGQLDDLFGVDRSHSALKEATAPISEKSKETEKWMLSRSGDDANAPAWPCKTVDVGVKATTATPLWSARLPSTGETVPVVFHRQVGQGHAYYMACHIFSQYSAIRDATSTEPEKVPVADAFQQWFAKLLADAGAPIHCTVWLRDAASDKTGLRSPYVWNFNKDSGKVHYCMVMRDFNIMTGTSPDKPARAPDQPVRAVFDRKAHIYEALSGKYLGYGDSVNLTLTDYTLRIFALLPYHVDEMDLKAPAEAARGDNVMVSAALAVSHGPADSHWFHVDVTGPDGRENVSYSGNMEAKDGHAEIRIPFALNDPVGAWQVRVQDVATGVSAESRIQLK